MKRIRNKMFYESFCVLKICRETKEGVFVADFLALLRLITTVIIKYCSISFVSQ